MIFSNLDCLRRVGAGLTLLAAALLLAACSGSRARPQPAELPPAVDLIGVRQAWAAQLPAAVDFPLQAQVLGTQVMLASRDGSVVTLDATTGRELARALVDAPLAAGVGSDGRVTAVVTRANEVVALDGSRLLWRERLATGSYTAPLVAGGRVFVLGADRSLTAFDGRTGARLWQLQRRTEPLVLRQAGVLLPVGNTLVAGLSGRLVGVNPDTGDILWEAPIASARGANDVERLIDLVGPAWRRGTVVCARAFQTAVGCVDTATAAVLWSIRANGATGVAGDGDLIFGTESDGIVRAWRMHDGTPAWTDERLRWRNLTAPLVLGRSVALGDESGQLHLLARRDGSPLGRFGTDRSGIAATPVAAADTLVVVTRSGAVFGYRPD